MRFDKVVKGGNVVTPGGIVVGDIGIIGEKIAAVGPGLDSTGATVIDAAGHHVIPGVLDVHVHLALPVLGAVSADDYRSATRAVARGGATALLDSALPSPGAWPARAAPQPVPVLPSRSPARARGARAGPAVTTRLLRPLAPAQRHRHPDAAAEPGDDRPRPLPHGVHHGPDDQAH